VMQSKRRSRFAMPLLLALAICSAQYTSAQDARFACPDSSCWCQDTYSTAEISVQKNVYYRTSFNSYSDQNQSLYLDEYVPPGAASTKRPGALIIHGGTPLSTSPCMPRSHICRPPSSRWLLKRQLQRLLSREGHGQVC
jgi:hypothetical protein